MNYTMVLEYGEQSLRTLLDGGRLQESACRTLTERLLQLVRHLHSRGVVHTDLRAEHVFLVGGEWKLVDLSHALLVGEPLPAARGIQPCRYVAPEVADYWLQQYGQATDGEGAGARSQAPAGALSLGVPADPSLDAWGLGLLLYELFCGVALFAGAKERKHFAALADGSCRIELGAVSSAAPRHLLAKLLRLDPAWRCSLNDLDPNPNPNPNPIPNPNPEPNQVGRVFLRQENLLHGRYFAELTRELFDNLEVG